MKSFLKMTGAFSVVLRIMLSVFVTGVFAADSGYTHLLTNNSPDCYADITIDGSHFTIDGRVTDDPAISVKFSTDKVTVSDYQFTVDEDLSFHAEFDAEFSGSWCEIWVVKTSYTVLAYRLHHDEDGWYFPENGLTRLNAEKLENITQAAPEAAAYYISASADPVEIEETLAELEQAVQEICGDQEDDYRKAYLIYRWISENFYYDKDAANVGVTLDTVAIHNVLERRRTTCAGFANTYCAMLEIAGIRSVNLKGSSVAGEVTYDELLTAGENHEFTAFWYEAENRWVYADPTWGRTGTYENGEYTDKYPPTYKYFDETGEAFALRHRIDKAEERSYLAALSALKGEKETEEETEDTSAEPSGTTETENSEENETTTTASAATNPPVTAQTDQTPQNGNFVIYIVIGVVGAATVITGIILLTRKK